ncbi:hypothetical protein C8F04DRAFT_1142564 [Mycena alexandri]|uniref:Uncharacterized protein n=1 Tax=Mycena alexandri TaxID=1745969 RepID=A0AAD6S423_9AGAR|nr:hypothetical protein C8F04DRAFT_1142564 [Mycena alexandri]
MKIANFYTLGLALSVAQWALGYWTVAHTPAANDAEDADGLIWGNDTSPIVKERRVVMYQDRQLTIRSNVSSYLP